MKNRNTQLNNTYNAFYNAATKAGNKYYKDQDTANTKLSEAYNKYYNTANDVVNSGRYNKKKINNAATEYDKAEKKYNKRIAVTEAALDSDSGVISGAANSHYNQTKAHRNYEISESNKRKKNEENNNSKTYINNKKNIDSKYNKTINTITTAIAKDKNDIKNANNDYYTKSLFGRTEKLAKKGKKKVTKLLNRLR